MKVLWFVFVGMFFAFGLTYLVLIKAWPHLVFTGVNAAVIVWMSYDDVLSWWEDA